VAKQRCFWFLLSLARGIISAWMTEIGESVFALLNNFLT
jgi:hypothetical protein